MIPNRFHTQDTLPDPEDVNLALQKAEEQIPVPSKIGPYQVESLLEKGGMSYLYLAIHPQTKIPITVKVLSPKWLQNEEIKKRFLKEAEIIKLADHPNIVKLYDQGEWEEGLYIAMEFIQGSSLRHLIEQQTISLKRSLEILLEIASALGHLHAYGIIHRDLKPENILITETGHIKVIDFGIAQLQSPEDERLTTQNKIMGTPVYMSPEQKQNPKDVSPSSDIYSLGIIAYELITGKLSHGVLHLSQIPKELRKIIKKCLEISPLNRYPDIVDFVIDIKSYLKTNSLTKDQRNIDQVNELSENLQQAQRLLLPQTTPSWKEVEIGFYNHQAQRVAGIYYDFFELPDQSYGILMGESGAKGVQGVLFSSVLRGMAHTLSRLTTQPIDMVTLLNDLLVHDTMDQIFTLSYLILSPKTNQLSFISCGYGHLWHIPMGTSQAKRLHADNVALGIDPQFVFEQISEPWHLGDSLFMHSFSVFDSGQKNNQKGIQEGQFEKILIETQHLTAEQQVQTIFRKIRYDSGQPLETRALTLISLQRIS